MANVSDYYCYDCDSGDCEHVREVLGTLVYSDKPRWGNSNLEVWRNGGDVFLVFRYDSDICREVFKVPWYDVFSVP